MEQKQSLEDKGHRLARARDSLEGLSVGDAFGERFFLPPGMRAARIEERFLPPQPWPYTDDTQMALSIFSMLRQYETVDQEHLADSFAEWYDPSRGYGPAMHQLLRSIRAGQDWHKAANNQFEGQGSFGNGAAMRAAPLGHSSLMIWTRWPNKHRSLLSSPIPIQKAFLAALLLL